jgi:hypothetical protein
LKRFVAPLILAALLMSAMQGGSSTIHAVYAQSVGQPTISIKTPLNNSVVYDPPGANCNDTSIGITLNVTLSDPTGLSLYASSAFNGIGPSWSPLYGAKNVNSAGGRTCGGGAQWHNGTVLSSWFLISDDGRIIKGSAFEFNVTIVDGGFYHAVVFANNTGGGVSVAKVFYTLRLSTVPQGTPPVQPQPTPTTITAIVILSVSLTSVILYRSRKRIKNSPE